MMMGWYGGGPGWLLMGLMILAFWALLIFGGIAVYRGTRGQGTESSGPATAVRLLDERFARGEIGADEYTRRRELLRSGR